MSAIKYPVGTWVRVNAPYYPKAHGLVGTVAQHDGSTTPYRVVFGYLPDPFHGLFDDVLPPKAPLEDDGWYREDQLELAGGDR